MKFYLKKTFMVLLSVLMLLNSTMTVFADDEVKGNDPSALHTIHYEAEYD